jgi:hypothetical protein
MTQFLLAQGVDASLLPKSVKMLPASSDAFLRNTTERIFGADAISDVVSVVCDNEEFDAVLMRAKRELIEGGAYEKTALNLLLVALTKAAKRVALWYGSDVADLEPVCDLQALTRVVREGLASPSVEVYALFDRQESN